MFEPRRLLWIDVTPARHYGSYKGNAAPLRVGSVKIKLNSRVFNTRHTSHSVVKILNPKTVISR